jgi:hypothetical protein
MCGTLFRSWLLPRLGSTSQSTPTHLVDLNPMPKSTLSPSQGLRIWPQVSHSSTITHTDERPPYIASPPFQLQLSYIVLLKGTVSGDFRLLVLFMNQFPPSTWVYQYGLFEFCSKIRGDIRGSRCTTGVVDIRNDPNVVFRGLGEGDSWKKPEAKNLVTLSL